jgi:hypothetical protein
LWYNLAVNWYNIGWDTMKHIAGITKPQRASDIDEVVDMIKCMKGGDNWIDGTCEEDDVIVIPLPWR